jgi:hypothetical protein
MHWPRLSVVQLAVLVMLVATIRLWLQAPNAQSPQETPPLPYRPGLGDLMTMTVQPRHIKLGLAGGEKNWAYAAYQIAASAPASTRP